RVGVRGECGWWGRLAAGARGGTGPPPAAGPEIDEVGHVAGGNLDAKRVTFDRGTIEKLRVRPHRRHRGHLVDDDLGRRRIAKHREQCSRRVVASALVDCRFTAFGDDVEDDIRAKRFLTAELKATMVVCSRLCELPGFAGACSPKSHGRICEGTTARLDLSLDPNAGPLLREPRARRRHGAERNKHTKTDSLGHAHGFAPYNAS